jgi:SAM-dependent methyltransferase
VVTRLCAGSTPPRTATVAQRLWPNYSAFAQVYDFLVGDPAHGVLRDAFLRAARRRLPGLSTLADVGCGTGRFLAWLARSSLALYGIDKSAAALAIARARLGPGRAVFLEQDIRSLELPARVDAVTCHNQTINYLLSFADLERGFAAVARSLNPRGAFFFDFIARPSGDVLSGPARSVESIRLPDIDIRFESHVDAARARSTVAVTFKPVNGARPAVEVHRQRWYLPGAIAGLLRRAGFDRIEMLPVSRFAARQWLYVAARRA